MSLETSEPFPGLRSGPPLLMGKTKPPKKSKSNKCSQTNPNSSVSTSSSEIFPPTSPLISDGGEQISAPPLSIAIGPLNSPPQVSLVAVSDPSAIADPSMPVSRKAHDLAAVSVKVVRSTGPDAAKTMVAAITSKPATNLPSLTVKAASVAGPVASNTNQSQVADSWSSLFKGPSKQLQKKGTTFTLPSGEACVKIPNSVIEKNRKSWTASS